MAFLEKKDYYNIAVISLIPIVFFTSVEFLSSGSTDRELSNGLYSLAYSAIVTIGLYVVNSLIVRWLQLHHPWQDGPLKRILLEGLLSIIFSSAWQAFVIYLSLEFVAEVSNVRAHYVNNIVFGIIITFIVLLIMEGAYFFNLWRDSLTRVQRMEKQQLQAQLDQLKAQVQPHFLFNSLNTLSAMLEIEKDIPRAVLFIEEFSLLYRRILENKDVQLVSLEEEIRFVEAYLLLQKERFTSALEVKINIKDSDKDKLVLPMAIQELLENAIKHNRMSRAEPLEIKITSEMHHLCISNPNRPKANHTPSTGTGLENLAMRLRLLEAPKLSVDHGEIFRVCIPLLPRDTPIKHFEFDNQTKPT